MARRCTKFYLLLIMVLIPFCGCEQNGQEPEGDGTEKVDGIGTGGSVKSGYTETLIYSGEFPIDTTYIGLNGEVDYRVADVYACDYVWTGLLVARVNEYNYSPWRIPTKKEAIVLKTLSMFDTDRYVCLDSESGVYYTFRYGGSITKAGSKTKYNVQPIRVEYKSDSIVIVL